MVSGEAVQRINLRAPGMRASVITLGATLSELHIPDNECKLGDVVLGFDSCEEYCSTSNPFFGCTVGRTAGRINPPSFTANGGTAYNLQGNDGGGGGIDAATNLHGGKNGFNKFVWYSSRVAHFISAYTRNG